VDQLESIASASPPAASVVVQRWSAWWRTLPKTRSGKTMRRVFRAVVLDRHPGDMSTIEDAGSVEEARTAWRELREPLRAD
jgi:hypothetical protein